LEGKSLRQNKPAGEIVRADRKEPLVVIPLRLATEVAAVAEGHKTHGWDAVHRGGAQGR